jgi:iron complex transport system ATP-binding protein
MIQVRHACKTFYGEPVLKDVSFTVNKQEWFGIIGPNGSGKTTLIKLISGVENLDSGTVLLEGTPVRDIPRRRLAQRLAVLQQEALPPVGFTVREVIEMGRYPFQNWLGREAEDTGGLIDSIIAKLDLQKLANKTLDTISGGERQRVALGKVMAQKPRILLLDEPTTYLDIGYQMQMLNYIRAWQREDGLTVVAVLHDLNLASLFCDRLMVLAQGSIVRTGTPAEIVNDELIYRVYGTRPIILQHPEKEVPQILLKP